MSFLKQILKPFIEFDETKPEQKVPTPQTPASALKKQETRTTSIDTTTHPLISEEKLDGSLANEVLAYAPTGSLDKPLPEHVAYFERLVDEANRTLPSFKGADYKEFLDNKVDIDDIADEALKYRTAYNMLKSAGLTKAKLLQTGQEYIEVIGRDLNRFQGAQSIRYQKELGAKEELIRKKAEELLTLQKTVNGLKSDINALAQEVNLVKEKMQTTRNSFLLAGEMKQNEINEDLKKIDRYFDLAP